MLIKSIRWFDGAALNSNEIETFGNKKTVGSREPKQLFSPCALYRASIYTHSWPSSLLGRFQWRRWASPNPLVFLSFFHAGVGGYMGFGSRIPLQLPILLHPFFVTSFVKQDILSKKKEKSIWNPMTSYCDVPTVVCFAATRLVLLMEGHRPSDPTGGSINLSQDLSQIITKISGLGVWWSIELNWTSLCIFLNIFCKNFFSFFFLTKMK